MLTGKLHLISPEEVADYLRSGPIHEAFSDIARLVDAKLTIEADNPPGQARPSRPADAIARSRDCRRRPRRSPDDQL